jgi:hypothetical protein
MVQGLDQPGAVRPPHTPTRPHLIAMRVQSHQEREQGSRQGTKGLLASHPSRSPSSRPGPVLIRMIAG